MEGLPSVGFYLLSSFRNPDQFVTVHLKIFSGYLWNLSVRPNIFSGDLWNFPSAPKSFQDIFGIFPSAPKSFQDIFGIFPSAPKSFQDILDNMIFLSNSAKPTFIYLSLSVGINLVLLLSSDPLTVIVGFACLVLSLSSLASFYLDQIMLDQESI